MTTKTRLLAFALAATAFVTTTAFAADSDSFASPAERGSIGHGPVERHPPIAKPLPILPPARIAKPPLAQAVKTPSQSSKTSPTTAVSGLRETGVTKAPPPCPSDPGAGKNCPGPGGPVPGGPGASGGGGGFGTVIPGGGNLDRCFEEFRCQTSVQ